MRPLVSLVPRPVKKSYPHENLYPRMKCVKKFCSTLKIFVRLARPCLKHFPWCLQCKQLPQLTLTGIYSMLKDSLYKESATLHFDSYKF